MTKMIKVASVCLASAALAVGASACGGSDTTTTTPAATTTEVVTTTTPATTTDPNGDSNGVQPITPASGGNPAECPSADPQYDPATGLCYPNGAKMPE